ncbi:MAG: CAP domain-containing protein [Velocimicrobium sp.]
MRKYSTAWLLVISMLVGVMFSSSIMQSKSGSYAQAATVRTLSQCKPKVSVASKSRTKVKLKITKVKGATKYKVYRSTGKKGTYKCIGTTKNTTFVDKKAGRKTCYYKVRAYNISKKAMVKSKCSKVVSVTKSLQNNTIGDVSNTPTNTPTNTPSSNESNSNSQATQSLADQVLQLVNQERAKAGLGELSTNDTLQKAANKRAEEIVTSFSHTRPNGQSCFTVLDEYNISYLAAGENIAYGQKSPSEVMDGWMNSSGHRANILGSQFGKVGIGVYQSSNGTYYWTQEFTN